MTLEQQKNYNVALAIRDKESHLTLEQALHTLKVVEIGKHKMGELFKKNFKVIERELNKKTYVNRKHSKKYENRRKIENDK